jgi:eukaryotic-like serine/threonine-protein kinase
MSLNPGTKLGPYEIQAQLGAGGMGEVYRAHDSRLDRTVAIKVLPASFSSNRDRLQRFAQEARAAAALNHPNILSIFDIGDDRGTPYVVSELLEGETLRDRLRAGAIPIRKAIDYGLQVMRGLSAAHDKGIVHRDLKPENLFLTKDGHVKILDFGLAKLTLPASHAESGDAPTIQAATEPGLVMGTVGYMSPEQVRGKAADARSDIFAFGAILYEMIAGKRAFHGDSAADAMSSILKDDPPELTETNRNASPALERIVRHCLEKNPEERFQSARDVAFSLEALTDVSTSARSGAVRSIPQVPSRRHWLLPVLGMILLLASWAAIYALARRSVQVSNPSFHQITFRRGTIWAARFAPDGQTIVYGASWDGQPQEVFSSRYDSSDSRAVGLPNAQVLSVSSNGELAVSLHPSDFSAFVQTGTLARVPLAGGAPREVLEGVAWADWTPDGQSLAVIRRLPGNNPGLELPPGNVIYKPNGWVSHVRVSPRGDLVAFDDHVEAGDDGRIVVTDIHGNHRTSSSFYGSVQGLAWTPDGKEVWFSAVPRGLARSIYAMDLSGKERLIYRAPGGLTIQDISRSGLVLVTGDQTRMTMTALPPGETTERSLSWFDWTLLSSMSGDGKVVAFSESGEAVGTDYSVFLRKTDGSPAVRLGEGAFASLSPDGHYVISMVGAPTKLVLLPTGVGETRDLTDNKTEHFGIAWLPDSKSFVFSTEEPGHGRRTFLQSIGGGSPRPITPEGTAGNIVTPDGKYLGSTDRNGQRWLYPIAGGEPQKVNITLTPDEFALGFTRDGKGLLVRTRSLPVRVSTIDITTGRRQPFKVIAAADTAGLKSIPVLKFSDDGKSYAYSTYRILSDLFVVDGMK